MSFIREVQPTKKPGEAKKQWGGEGPCFPGLFFLGATLFSRNVISLNCPFAEMQFCRIVVCKKKKNLPKVIFPNRSAESNFYESSFSRTSFLRIVVQPNVIFRNRRSAERRFPETSVARTSFCRNCMKQNVISPNTK